MNINVKVWVLAALSFGLAGGARADLAEGCVAYWPLDVINGSTTPDFASGNVVGMVGGINLVPSTVPYGAPGLFTNAFSFPSTLAYFTTAGTTQTGLPVFLSPGGYTVSMWVNAPLPTAATHYLYTEANNTGNNTPLFLIQSASTGSGTNLGKLDILIRGSTATQINHIVSTNVVFDGTWHHFAWVDNHGATALYIDGKLDPATSHLQYTPAGVYAMTDSTVGALVRAAVAANVFTGMIDNVGIWSRPLSQAEVQQFMTNGIPLPIAPSKPTAQSTTPGSTNALGDFPPTFSAIINGSQPINFQWYSNNVPVGNANSSSLTLSNLTLPGTTVYALVSTNLLGALTNTFTEVVLPDPPVNVPAGLISYWPLDTITALPSTPDVVNHEDMLLLPAGGTPATLTTGQFSNAMAFDAGFAQAAASFQGVPNYDLTNYSVSLWVQGQPQLQMRVFSESSSQSSSPLFTIGTEITGFLPYASILIRNDQGTVLVNNLSSGGTAFDGNWHHLVWTDSNGTALLYIDGVLDPVSFSYVRSGTFTLDTTSLGAIVRSAAPDHAFTGNIDDVGVWNRRLSYSEIQSLLTNTIPLPSPLTITPPSVFSMAVNPPDPTNYLYVGDRFSLEVLAEGTQPLNCQWLKDGLPIDPGLNPTATNSLFSIASVGLADSGAYCLVISNGDPVLLGGGVVTSAVVTATVQIPATNGLALQLDINLAGSPATQPGFQMYNTSLAGDNFANAIQVTVSGVGTTLAARNRNPPTTTAYVANGPGLTQALLYNSFIFANSATPGTGLQILLANLAPNTPYKVILWSFDPVSGGNRVSDWTEISSGVPIVIETNYVFNGAVMPTMDYQDTLSATLTSSSTGTLLIQGLTDANNTSFGAFINAIKLVANPGPSVTITGVAMAPDGNLRITTSGQYAGQPIEFSSSPGLSPPNWQRVLNSITVTNLGTTCVTELPITPSTTPQLFFRAQGF